MPVMLTFYGSDGNPIAPSPITVQPVHTEQAEHRDLLRTAGPKFRFGQRALLLDGTLCK